MNEIKYKYAFNDNDEIIDIENVDDTYRQKHTFHCIECGKELIPRIGVKNTHHFAHKSTDVCDPDKYLHTLSELLFKQKFDTEGLSIKIGQVFICSRQNQCLFYDNKYGSCAKYQETMYDLRKYYDTCAIEKKIGSFVADLLLYSSRRPEIDPLLIEIKVTHSCTEQKISSDYKIIEVTILDENQLLAILNSGCLEENGNFDDSMHQMIFFNGAFQREISGKKDLIGKSQVSRFILYASMSCFLQHISCSESRVRVRPDSICEMNLINLEYSDDFLFKYGNKIKIPEDICLFKVVKEKPAIRNCKLCKYHKYHTSVYSSTGKLFCCLYKKYGLDEFPKQTDAINCNYYRLDSELIDSVLNDIQDLKFEILSV